MNNFLGVQALACPPNRPAQTKVCTPACFSGETGKLIPAMPLGSVQADSLPSLDAGFRHP